MKETDLVIKMKYFIWSSTLDPFIEKGWKSVLKKYKLEGYRWLWEMYAIKISWILAFFYDGLVFGLMRTTLRSESWNNFFSQFYKQSDTMCEFYLHFSIQPPNRCLNKGSDLKRLISHREKAILEGTNDLGNASYVFQLFIMLGLF